MTCKYAGFVIILKNTIRFRKSCSVGGVISTLFFCYDIMMTKEIQFDAMGDAMNKKRLKKRNKLEIFIMLTIFFLSVITVSFISVHQFSADEIRIRNFFICEKNTIDVVHIGASEIYTGFSPEFIWRNYGITSYNLATAGAPMRLAKSEIRAAQEEQEPQLMVVSLNGTMYDDERSTNEAYTRMWIDNMPHSFLRNETIIEWIDEQDRLNYYIKLFKYHTNLFNENTIKDCIRLSMQEIKTKKDKRLLTIRGIQGTAATDKKRNTIDVSKFDNEREMYPLAKEQ